MAPRVRVASRGARRARPAGACEASAQGLGLPCAGLHPSEVPLLARLARSRAALWSSFVGVHLWVGFVGVVWIPQRAFWDLDLYRYWMWLGLHDAAWPVLSSDWVYPAGAMVPMLLAAVLGGTGSGAGYAVAWTVLIAGLNAWGVTRLLRHPRGEVAAWWWVGFVLALGPVGVGRLDAVVAPLSVVALLEAVRRPRLAAALLTAGAWIKVAPGALLASVFYAAQRPWREVVAPAAAVSLAVTVPVVVFGGAPHLLSFMAQQGERGLQVEAPGATPWLLAGLATASVERYLNQDLISWEISGPGTVAMATTLGVAFMLGLAAAVALLWWCRARLGRRFWVLPGVREQLVADGALLLVLTMLVTNKVGSPQYMVWLVAPVAVALAQGLPGWRPTAWAVLAIGAATQLVFPWAYDWIIAGAPAPTLVLAARNVALVVLVVLRVRSLVRTARSGDPLRRAEREAAIAA